jgi:hypothetical protein
LLEQIAKTGKPLLIVSEDVEGKGQALPSHVILEEADLAAGREIPKRQVRALIAPRYHATGKVHAFEDKEAYDEGETNPEASLVSHARCTPAVDDIEGALHPVSTENTERDVPQPDHAIIPSRIAPRLPEMMRPPAGFYAALRPA